MLLPRLAAGAGRAALAVDEDGRRVDEPLADEGRERNDGARRVASRVRHEPRPRGRRAHDLGEPEVRLREPRGRRVREAVVSRVRRSIGEPVGARQIDDPRVREDLRREASAHLRAGRKEDEIDLAGQRRGLCVRREAELTIGETRAYVVLDEGAFLLVARREREVHLGVRREERDEDPARVAGGPDDADPGLAAVLHGEALTTTDEGRRRAPRATLSAAYRRTRRRLASPARPAACAPRATLSAAYRRTRRRPASPARPAACAPRSASTGRQCRRDARHGSRP